MTEKTEEKKAEAESETSVDNASNAANLSWSSSEGGNDAQTTGDANGNPVEEPSMSTLTTTVDVDAIKVRSFYV